MVVLKELESDQRADGADVPVILLRGEVDLGCGEAFRDAFAQAADGPARRIVVDVSAVTFLDGGGLRLLEQTAAASGREVWLRAPSRPVRRIAELAGGIGPNGWTGSTLVDDVRLS